MPKASHLHRGSYVNPKQSKRLYWCALEFSQNIARRPQTNPGFTNSVRNCAKTFSEITFRIKIGLTQKTSCFFLKFIVTAYILRNVRKTLHSVSEEKNPETDAREKFVDIFLCGKIVYVVFSQCEPSTLRSGKPSINTVYLALQCRWTSSLPCINRPHLDLKTLPTNTAFIRSRKLR